MPLSDAQKPLWDRIDTVLLDLDGTLLDLEFDNYFWREHVPAHYGASRELTLEEARAELVPKFRAKEGTLEWYCVEYWSRALDLDIVALKHAVRDRVAWLPGAKEFLKRVRGMGKRLVLVTNAHPEALRIKDERTGVTRYFDAVFSSHRFGAPKEDPAFWDGLHRVEPFDRERTMFVDDSAAVLRAAKRAGIKWIYAVRKEQSRDPWQEEEFAAVDSVARL